MIWSLEWWYSVIQEAIEHLGNEVYYVFANFEKQAGLWNVAVKEVVFEMERKAYLIKSVFIDNGVFKATEEEVAEGKGELVCLICFSELRSLVNMPCGHACVGEDCIYKYFEKGGNRECPVCRQSRLFLLDVESLVSIKNVNLGQSKHPSIFKTRSLRNLLGSMNDFSYPVVDRFQDGHDGLGTSGIVKSPRMAKSEFEFKLQKDINHSYFKGNGSSDHKEADLSKEKSEDVEGIENKEAQAVKSSNIMQGTNPLTMRERISNVKDSKKIRSEMNSIQPTPREMEEKKIGFRQNDEKEGIKISNLKGTSSLMNSKVLPHCPKKGDPFGKVSNNMLDFQEEEEDDFKKTLESPDPKKGVQFSQKKNVDLERENGIINSKIEENTL